MLFRHFIKCKAENVTDMCRVVPALKKGGRSSTDSDGFVPIAHFYWSKSSPGTFPFVINGVLYGRGRYGALLSFTWLQLGFLVFTGFSLALFLSHVHARFFAIMRSINLDETNRILPWLNCQKFYDTKRQVKMTFCSFWDSSSIKSRNKQAFLTEGK